jgi:archaellum component FlaC
MSIMEKHIVEIAEGVRDAIAHYDQEAPFRLAHVLIRIFAGREELVSIDQLATKDQLTEVIARQSGTDRRFDRIDERFDGIDRRLDRMDERFDGIDQRLDRMDERFDGMDERFDGMDERFDGIDQRLDRMDARFDGIDTQFVYLNKRLDDLIHYTNRRLSQMMWVMGLLMGSINVFIIMRTLM